MSSRCRTAPALTSMRASYVRGAACPRIDRRHILLSAERPAWARGAGHMVWQTEVEEIERRRAIARGMGGEEAVARHRAAGRLTVRERIERLPDPGSFAEMGVLAAAAEYDEAGTPRRPPPSHPA